MFTRPLLILLFPICCFLHFVFGQWFGDSGGMGGMEMGGGAGDAGGGAGGGGGGGAGMGNEELSALELLKTVMERRAASNRRLREQLERTNRELRGANDELKTTRERIEELGTRCEQFGRIKDVLREKIAEIEEIFENTEQGGGGGAGGGGGQQGGSVARGGGGSGRQFMYGGGRGGGGAGGGAQEIWNSDDEALTMSGRKFRLRIRRATANDGEEAALSRKEPLSARADIALCELEPNIQHKLERELDKTQQRITQLKGMERRISVSLFLARLF